MRDVSMVPPSTKEQIATTAERLFAERGIDGVSLRQIGVASGSGNHSVVQYHFGSKERLVGAIFEYRLPRLDLRRRTLVAQLAPSDLRSWVHCYVLPILEQGEQPDSHYLSFVAMLQQSSQRHLFQTIPPELLASTTEFRDHLDVLLAHIPAPLRAHRVEQAVLFAVHASAIRERTRAGGHVVAPFALHVADLLDGLVGFLQADVSDAALAVLDDDAYRAHEPLPLPI
jgi:AcrR family transcriptional regulator